MSETGSLQDMLAGGVGLGGGFAAVRWWLQWLIGRADRRQALLDAEHERLDGGWREYRQQLEGRLRSVEGLADKVHAIRLAFELVAGELRRVDPGNTTLRHAEVLLQGAFPLDPVVPANAVPPHIIAALDTIPGTGA